MSWRIALAWLVLCGCGDDPEPLTQLALVADSDLALDSITFEVRGTDGSMRMATASRTGTGPSFVSLVHETGPLTGITISATGSQGNKPILTRTHVVSFVADETRVVPLDLYASCIGVMCRPGETCLDARCVPQELTADELPNWRGKAESPFPSDAGPPDGGWLRQCGAPKPVDTSKDPMNCGDCALKCADKERCELGRCLKKD